MIKKIFFQIIFFNLVLIGKVFGAESGGMPQLNPEFWISQIFWLILTFGKISFERTKYKIPKVSDNQNICETQNSGFN